VEEEVENSSQLADIGQDTGWSELETLGAFLPLVG